MRSSGDTPERWRTWRFSASNAWVDSRPGCGNYVVVPVLLVVSLFSTFVIHPGHPRTLAHARPGDKVVCEVTAGSIEARVPSRVSGSTRSTIVWSRQLELTLGPRRGGGITAVCDRR